MLTPSIKKNMHWIGVALLALTQSAISWEVIAHRGVFHDQHVDVAHSTQAPVANGVIGEVNGEVK